MRLQNAVDAKHQHGDDCLLIGTYVMMDARVVGFVYAKRHFGSDSALDISTFYQRMVLNSSRTHNEAS